VPAPAGAADPACPDRDGPRSYSDIDLTVIAPELSVVPASFLGMGFVALGTWQTAGLDRLAELEGVLRSAQVPRTHDR
jgi:hypothetical protein